MNTSRINRRTAAVLTAAVTLGAAGPAAAQPIGNGPVLVAPPARAQHYGEANVLPPYTGMPAPAVAKPAASARPKVSQPASGSDLIYVLIGGVVVAVGGLGGTLVAAGRRRTAPRRARIAA